MKRLITLLLKFSVKIVFWIGKLEKMNKFNCFTNNDYYILFNYTNTIDLYLDRKVSQSNICYLHGTIVRSKFGWAEETIIFGHNNTTKTDWPYYDEFKEYFIKDTKQVIKSHESFFESLMFKNITNVAVIGFSYSEIDFPYFDHIFNNVLKNRKRNLTVELHYFTERDLVKAKKYASRLNLLNYKFINDSKDL